MAKRKLGRGLDVLIGKGRVEKPAEEPESGNPAVSESSSETVSPEPVPEPEAALASSEAPARPAKRAGKKSASSGGAADIPAGPGMLELSPGDIEVNPDQPRTAFSREDLDSLKTSVSREGVLQPVLVRRQGNSFQLIAGERRWRAAQELALKSIPARVVDVPDERLLELALIENIHRANLNPIELAEAYRDLMNRKRWTQVKLAENLGLSRSAVANTLRLLDLSSAMQQSLASGQISMGHAKVLLSVDDHQARQLLYERIAEENFTVRELEEAREIAEPASPAARPSPAPKGNGKKPYLLSLEQELSEKLKTRVRIVERRSGKGVLSIEFYSRDDFDRLRELLLG